MNLIDYLKNHTHVENKVNGGHNNYYSNGVLFAGGDKYGWYMVVNIPTGEENETHTI